MSNLTETEQEEIFVVDRCDSFKQIPVSKNTIGQWKKFLYDRDKKNYSESEVLKIIKSDPNPKEYEEKQLVNETRDYRETHQRSNIVKCIVLDNGDELEEYEELPNVEVPEFETEVEVELI